MDLETPRMLYRAGGSVLLESGAYSTRIAKDAGELQALLADGWHLDQYAARDAQQAEQERAAREASGKPPKREDLERQAEALGIAYGPKVSDKKLAAAIEEKRSALA